MTDDLFTDKGATFSPCRIYRYKLWRIWDAATRYVLFLMLNPSTADETLNDPTVDRCEHRARKDGWGGLVVANLFAIRTKDPVIMKKAVDPVGPDNDRIIRDAVYRAGLVVCAWGVHGTHRGRDQEVLKMIRDVGSTVPHHLGLTKHGHPRHPLYLGYDISPQQFEVTA